MTLERQEAGLYNAQPHGHPTPVSPHPRRLQLGDDAIIEFKNSRSLSAR
jgi:hypothetical protein